MKKTLVFGASPNPARVSYDAVSRLSTRNYPVVAVGARAGHINSVEIHTDRPKVDNIDTITLYLNPARQKEEYDYLLGLKPKRIIFNPGTENPEFIQLAQNAGIQTEVACTLVLLSLGSY